MCVLLICDGSRSLGLLGGVFLGTDIGIYSRYTENDKQQLKFLSSSSIALIIFIVFNCFFSYEDQFGDF